jgi:hypothetical protein
VRRFYHPSTYRRNGVLEKARVLKRGHKTGLKIHQEAALVTTSSIKEKYPDLFSYPPSLRFLINASHWRFGDMAQVVEH